MGCRTVVTPGAREAVAIAGRWTASPRPPAWSSKLSGPRVSEADTPADRRGRAGSEIGPAATFGASKRGPGTGSARGKTCACVGSTRRLGGAFFLKGPTARRPRGGWRRWRWSTKTGARGPRRRSGPAGRSRRSSPFTWRVGGEAAWAAAASPAAQVGMDRGPALDRPWRRRGRGVGRMAEGACGGSMRLILDFLSRRRAPR